MLGARQFILRMEFRLSLMNQKVVFPLPFRNLCCSRHPMHTVPTRSPRAGDAESPGGRGSGYRLQRTALNLSSVRRIWLACLLTGFNLLLWTGCQSVSKNSSVGGSGVLTLNPAQVSFGNVNVGSNHASSVSLSNTGTADLTINQATLSGAGFTMSNMALPMTLHAGGSTSITLTFAPTGSGSFTGSVTFVTTGAQGTVSLPLSGTGVAPTPGSLSANPTSVGFGSIQVGSSSSQSETVTNTGGTTVNISQANVTGSVFSVTGLTLPTTLTAGGSVTFTVKFAPTSAGTLSGSLSLVSDASNSPLNIALSGTATTPGQLSVSPATLTFGNVAVGSSSPLSGSLSASSASVTVSSASSNSSEFVLSGITLPATISAGQSLGFTVTFTPGATGSASANLTFVSNATNAPTAESLTGTGTAPAHSVALSWNASTGATSYDVYRGTATGVCSGSPTPYGTATTTSYTDTSVTAGATYIYAVSAVNSAGQSACSTEVSATIPTP